MLGGHPHSCCRDSVACPDWRGYRRRPTGSYRGMQVGISIFVVLCYIRAVIPVFGPV